MGVIDWPLQLKRQYSAPIDPDAEFATTLDRNNYLSNPLCYAGQIVYDKELDKHYAVNITKTGFNPVGGMEAGADIMLEAADVTVSGGINVSPSLILRGKYDSDATVGVISTKKDFSFNNRILGNGTHFLDFKDDTGNVLATFASSGRLGIGTSNPERELHVKNGVALIERDTDSAAFMLHRTGLATFFFGLDATASTRKMIISDFTGVRADRISIDHTGLITHNGSTLLKGSGSDNTTSALKVENATGVVGLEVKNDGSTYTRGLHITSPHYTLDTVSGNSRWPFSFIDGGGIARSLIGLTNDTAADTLLNITTAAGAKFMFVKGGDANSPLASIDSTGNLTLAGTLAATSLSGTLDDARLSSNVALKNAGNVFTTFNAFERVDAANGAIGVRVTGDTVNRLLATVGGVLQWSTGAAASDTNLYRSAVNILRTDHKFEAGGNITSHGTFLGVNFQNRTSGVNSSLILSDTGAQITTALNANVGLKIQNVSASATGDLTQWLNPNGSVAAKVDNSGNAVFKGVTVTGLTLGASAGYSINFFGSTNYKIYMDNVSSTRLDGTSDYNIKFGITGGTNRGYVWLNSGAAIAQIDGGGNLYLTGTIKNGAVTTESIKDASVTVAKVNPAEVVGISDVPATEKTKLETVANWDANGVYTGTPLLNTYMGQRHYTIDYMYFAVEDNVWIRTIRG